MEFQCFEFRARRIRGAAFAAGLFAMWLLTAPQALAVTIHVATSGTDQASCGDVASPCQSLGYALALAAVTGPGDVIDLAAGTYSLDTQLTVTKGGVAGDPLTIQGAGPTTVLDGVAFQGGDMRVIRLNAAYITIAGMTLTESPGAPLRIAADGVAARDLVLSTPRGNGKPCVEVVSAADVLLERLDVRGCTGNGIFITDSSSITVSATEVSGAATTGINASDSTDVTLEAVWVHDNNTGGTSQAIIFRRCAGLSVTGGPDKLPSIVSGGPSYAINVIDGSGGLIEHTLIHGTVGAIKIGEGTAPTDLDLLVDHVTIGTVTGNEQFVDTATGTSLTVRNSILAFNPDGDLTDAATTHHHNLRFGNGTVTVALDPTEVELDPLFAASAGGDYHLRSAQGRYESGSGWGNDAETSPAIDIADPASSFALETMENGGRANAGAYGNTPQASRSGPGQDAGVVADAAVPDTSAPDSAAPDNAVPDSAAPDAGAPDSASADTAAPDTAALDTAALDAASVDTATPDAATLDSSATDSVTTSDAQVSDTAAPDGALADSATVVDAAIPDALSLDATPPDTSSNDLPPRDGGAEDTFGQIVIARGGADQIHDAPAHVLLDGTASTAPEGAFYVWTMADGPLGAGADPLGAAVDVQVDLDIPGLYIFQLTITWAGMSDSDLVAITINEVDGGEVAAPCECASARATGLPTGALLLIAVGLLLARRRLVGKPR